MIYDDVLLQARLFAGIDRKEMKMLLKVLNAQTETYEKEERILNAGDEVTFVGLVLAGQANVIKEDADGERALVARLLPGDHFAEALCCAGIKHSPVSVVAEEATTVLLLNFQRMMSVAPGGGVLPARLANNMMMLLAEKSLYLQERMTYLSKKTIRKKLLKYLLNASKNGNSAFTIPYNREELADYLCVDRSALSRELSKLKQEKMIDYWKNHFKVM